MSTPMRSVGRFASSQSRSSSRNLRAVGPRSSSIGMVVPLMSAARLPPGPDRQSAHDSTVEPNGPQGPASGGSADADDLVARVVDGGADRVVGDVAVDQHGAAHDVDHRAVDAVDARQLGLDGVLAVVTGDAGDGVGAGGHDEAPWLTGVTTGVAGRGAGSPSARATRAPRKRRRRSELVTTNTDEKPMAPAAIIGSSKP